MLKLSYPGRFYMYRCQNFESIMAITNINNKDQINKSASVVNTSTTTTGATKSDNVSIIETKKPKDEILKQLGITAEQYLEICTNNPSFETLSLEQQLEYISKANTKNPTDKQIQQDNTATSATATSTTENASTQSTEASQETSGFFFDKASFSQPSKTKEDINAKINTYIQEHAKNRFMFADENNLKSAEDWDALSDEEKAKYIKDSTKILDSNYGELLQGSSLSTIDAALDVMMTELLAASHSQLSIDQFYGIKDGDRFVLDQIGREEAVYSYLNDVDLIETDMNCKSSLSEIDKQRLERERVLSNAVADITGNENICLTTAKEYLKLHNITEYEVVDAYLNKKLENGEKLSEYETKKYNEFKELKSSETFSILIKDAKYQGLQNLKEQYKEAVAEGNENKAKEIKQVLNSPESKAIKKWGRAHSKEEVKTTEEYEAFMSSHYGINSNKGAFADPAKQAGLVLSYLAEEVPEEKRAEVFVKILQGFKAQGPEKLDVQIKLLEIGLQKEEYAEKLAKEADLATLNMSANNNVRGQKKMAPKAKHIINKRNVEAMNNAKTDEAKAEQRKMITESIAVERTHGTNETKNNTINDYAELSSDDEIGVELIEANISITDVNIQRNNIPKINKNASEKVKIHGAENSYRLLEGNQAYGLDVYTKGSQAATEAAAKAGVYSKFAESEQIEGFKITNQRIEELFKGQEKIDLLKTTSDFIENCAIDNQSELYDVALNSKYSEVSDYVSSKMESSNKEVLNIVSNLNSDYKSVTGKDIEVYNNEGTISNIVSEFRIAMEQNDTQRQIQLLGKIPSNMLSSAISKISMYNVNLLATFVRLGRGNELLKIPGMSSDVTSKVIHLMLNSSLKDQKVAAKYVVENKNYFSKSTLERCQELLQDNKNTYTSAPMGGVKSALQPSMSAIYPGKKQMFYKA